MDQQTRTQEAYKKRPKRVPEKCDPLTLDEVVELWVDWPIGGDPKMEWCSDDREAREDQIGMMLFNEMGRAGGIEFKQLFDSEDDDYWLIREGHDRHIFWRDDLREFAVRKGFAPNFLLKTKQKTSPKVRGRFKSEMDPKLYKQIREPNSARVHGDYEKRKKILVRCDPLTRTEVAELWVRGGDPNMEWCSDDYEAREQQVDEMLVLAMGRGSIAWDELEDDHWLVLKGHFPQIFWRKHLKLFAKDMDRAPKFLLKTKQPDRNRDG